jgi:hypothetical protein
MTSQVQIVFLYHPTADSRSSPLPDAFIKRIETLYQASKSTIQIAHIRYGSLPKREKSTNADSGSVNLERFLSSSSSLVLTPFHTATKHWQQQREAGTQDPTPSFLLNVINNVKQPRMESMQDSLDTLMNQSDSSTSDNKPLNYLGCLADGLVAAIEVRHVC